MKGESLEVDSVLPVPQLGGDWVRLVVFSFSFFLRTYSGFSVVHPSV